MRVNAGVCEDKDPGGFPTRSALRALVRVTPAERKLESRKASARIALDEAKLNRPMDDRNQRNNRTAKITWTTHPEYIIQLGLPKTTTSFSGREVAGARKPCRDRV